MNSMTGYGNFEQAYKDVKIGFEIKSVNSRYLDINIKTLRQYSYMEEIVRKIIKSRISRGRVEVYINIGKEQEEETVSLNESVIKGYVKTLKDIKDKYGLGGEISLDVITRLPEVFRAENEELKIEPEIISEVFEKCLEKFNISRAVEGEALRVDLVDTINYIRKASLLIDTDTICDEYRTKLKKRIEEILSGVLVDEGRLLNEVAFFAERIDVNEELQRLRIHTEEFLKFSDFKEPIGKKLDFILQEMNREINTIGSKVNNSEVSKIVIDIKSHIEKAREQVQNIE